MTDKILKFTSVGEEGLELINILNNIIKINPEVENYCFSIKFLDGSAKIKFEGNFMDFIDDINDTKEILIYDYQTIKNKFQGIFQIYDLLLFIDKDAVFFREYSFEEENIMYENIYITIAYFDGGFWEISCKDKIILEKLEIIYTE